MDISEDKKHILSSLQPGQAVLISGEAGTGKTLLGLLCGEKLLRSLKPWQKVLYLTYSKLARRQITDCLSKLKEENTIDENLSRRVEILNYHSLWWNLLCANYQFLGIAEPPRMQRKSERDSLVSEFLKGLKLQEKIPREFLTKEGKIDQRKEKEINDIARGIALVYSQWDCVNFGDSGKKFENHRDLIDECTNQITTLNKRGLFWHDETIWWADRLLRSHPNILSLLKTRFPVMIIDEFQDTDEAQWDIVKLMTPETIIVFGDPKQTIHRWRGASENRLRNFKELFGRREHYSFSATDLVTNHRTRQEGPNFEWKNIDESKPNLQYEILYKIKKLVKSTCKDNHAILCRTNSQTDDVCHYFRKKQMFKNGGCLHPYHVGIMGSDNSPSEAIRELVSTLHDLRETKDFLNLQGFIANDLLRDLLPFPKSDLPECSERSRKENQVRWINAGSVAASLGTQFAEGLLSLKKFIEEECQRRECYSDRNVLNGLKFMANAIARTGKRKWNSLSPLKKQRKIDGFSLQFEEAYAWYKERVIVQTVHQAKGREYEVVIIPWFVGFEGTWPIPNQPSSFDTEQINVFHTACTRAKKKVIVLSTKQMIEYLQKYFPQGKQTWTHR